jgi:hypothetical protein
VECWLPVVVELALTATVTATWVDMVSKSDIVAPIFVSLAVAASTSALGMMCA